MNKKINLLKFMAILIFILTPLPSEKFHVINGLGLIILLNNAIMNTAEITTSIIIPIIAFIGILMIFLNRLRANIIGFSLCFIYLISILFINDRAINYILFLILAATFLLISMYSTVLIIKKLR